MIARCSSCGHEMFDSTNYCPICGARMQAATPWITAGKLLAWLFGTVMLGLLVLFGACLGGLGILTRL